MVFIASARWRESTAAIREKSRFPDLPVRILLCIQHLLFYYIDFLFVKESLRGKTGRPFIL